MTPDAFTPDARFFNDDGSINYREALTAGTVARGDTMRKMMAPAPKAAKPTFATRIASLFRPSGATA